MVPPPALKARIMAEVEREAALLAAAGPEADRPARAPAPARRRTWFGLPAIVAEAIERDRAALGLGRLEYLQYLVFRRYEALVKHGPGFDKVGEKTRSER